jgi:hypothetical protein
MHQGVENVSSDLPHVGLAARPSELFDLRKENSADFRIYTLLFSRTLETSEKNVLKI